MLKKEYDIAAYFWPSYQSKEPRARLFWPKGEGEWEVVKDAKALFQGHPWPRIPLWGYLDESKSDVMEFEIDEALKYGINTFIFDWYYYDSRPFLEACLDEGFLKAKNNCKMKFYLMWANHNVTYGWDKRNATIDSDTIIYKGTVTFDEFKIIAERMINKYFKLNNYYKINNKPVLSIYDLCNLIKGLGNINKTKEALIWFDNRCKEEGFSGIHYQVIDYGKLETSLSGFDKQKTYTIDELSKLLPISSVTHYQFIHFTYAKDYLEMCDIAYKEWEKEKEKYSIPYYPHVSIGWDNTPRYPNNVNNICTNNTAENFEIALRKAKEFADKNNINLITINSWNEWTEDSYLIPDDYHGYSLLEAIKKVFND